MLRAIIQATQLVLDHSSGISGTAMAWTLLLKQRQFVGSEVKTFCFAELLAGVMEAFARQVSNEESDLRTERMVEEAAKVLSSELNETNV